MSKQKGERSCDRKPFPATTPPLPALRTPRCLEDELPEVGKIPTWSPSRHHILNDQPASKARAMRLIQEASREVSESDLIKKCTAPVPSTQSPTKHFSASSDRWDGFPQTGETEGHFPSLSIPALFVCYQINGKR